MPLEPDQVMAFRRVFAGQPNEALAERFGLTLDEVERLGVEYGLAKDKAIFPGTTKAPRWSAKELELLRKLHAEKSNLELARILGRSQKSVTSKAHALGLKKSRERLRVLGHENVSRRRSRGFVRLESPDEVSSLP